MSIFTDRAAGLRAVETPHYNCAQSTLMPFAEAAGLSEEDCRRVAANFGGGMRRASVCGAVTGGLMALGLFGIDDAKTAVEFQRAFMEKHGGMIDCADLLRQNAIAGEPKKPACDRKVLECVELVEEILKREGKL